MGKAGKGAPQLKPILFLAYEGSVLASGEKEWNLMKPMRNDADLEPKHCEYSDYKKHKPYFYSLVLSEACWVNSWSVLFVIF